MGKFKEQHKTILWFFILPLSVFILFKKGIDEFLRSFFVNPFLSQIYPSSWRFDLIIIVLFLIALTPIIENIRRGIRIPFQWYLISVIYLITYLIYRISHFFEFTSFSFDRDVKLLDLISLIPVVIIVSPVFYRKKLAALPTVSTDGFIVDEASTITVDNDILHRQKFVQRIADKIKQTTSPNGSFPIGVVAAWGAGKTTFLNTLLSRFNEENFITIELNVWKCNDSNQIIETLFKLLKEKLKRYSFNIDSQLQNYAINLLKSTTKGKLDSLTSLVELIFPNENIEKQYDNISLELRRIDKRIIILIDDIDRLDKREIYEVIRLIRNTANFPNTFFVVAYDRNYILNAIEEINSYQSHLFLEKIFQVEFTLPPVNFQVLRDEISKLIEPFLSVKGMEAYKAMQEVNFSSFNGRKIDLTKLFISNIRDVVRFINSFKLTYEFVKDEVYFSDLYNLELVRFKHPEVFAEVYRNHQKYLTTATEKKYRTVQDISTYSLLKKHKDGEEPISELKVYLLRERFVYKLSDEEIETIVGAYNTLFPTLDTFSSSNQGLSNFHLSVMYPSKFDRYFTLGIEGKLSEIVFSKIRDLSSENFNKGISELCNNKQMIEEVLDRFQQIKEFDNRADFEKIVKGIFHLANLRHPDREGNHHFEFIRYNGKSLSELLGNQQNEKSFYGSKEEYKEFLLSLLQTTKPVYTYTNDFVSYLLHDGYYNISNILTSDEISELLLRNFKNAVSKSTHFTVQLWWLFLRCEIRNEVPQGYNSWQIFYPKNKEAQGLLRKFICERDIDGFIRFSIRQDDFGEKFSLDQAISYVFKSHELFVYLLRRRNVQTKYSTEFLAFYKALQTEGKTGIPLEFFKVIPVKSLQLNE